MRDDTNVRCFNHNAVWTEHLPTFIKERFSQTYVQIASLSKIKQYPFQLSDFHIKYDLWSTFWLIILPIGTDVTLPLSSLVGEIPRGTGLRLVTTLRTHKSDGTDDRHAVGGACGTVVSLGTVSFFCGQSCLLAVVTGRTIGTLPRGHEASCIRESARGTVGWCVCSWNRSTCMCMQQDTHSILKMELFIFFKGGGGSIFVGSVLMDQKYVHSFI